MKKITTCVFLTCISIVSFASNFKPSATKENDEYLVSQGKKIFGDTEVNLVYDDAILRLGKDIFHFPPSQIEKVAVIDEVTGDVILYHSGSFGFNHKQYLFEILVEGQTTLLYRKGLKFSPYEEEEYSPYFILFDEHIYSLSKEKKELIKQLDSRFQKEIATYIKDKKLKISNHEDMIKLFDHYNLMTLE